MIEFVNSIKDVYANQKPYKQWHKEQKELEARRLEYAKQNPLSKNDAEFAQSYGKTLIESINVMDEYSQKRSEHVEEALNQAGGFVPYIGLGAGLIPMGLYKLISKNPNPAIMSKLVSLPIAGFVLSTVAYVIAASSMQKTASRIARYQARETELKDPKNFVIYTPEQQKEAEEIAKSIADNDVIKKEPNKLNPINQFNEIKETIKSLFRDKKGYKQWLEQNKLEKTEKEKLFNIEPSNEQLIKAKSFQDVLFRTVQKIDIASQDYSENIETLTESFTLSAPIIGGVIGGIVSGAIHILQKAKIAPLDSKALHLVKKFASPASAILLPLVTCLYFVQLQVEASRVGRHKAKKELQKDPYNFIHINEQKLNTIQNDSNKEKNNTQSLMNKLFANFKEFIQIRKDFKEYKNYKKTDRVNEDKIKKALEQVQITDTQLDEATKLQDKTFMVFEKMDEMSQRYAEDVEAGTGLAVIAAMPILMGTTFKAGFTVMNKFPKYTAPAMILMNVANIAGILGMSMLATKIQKKASKIGLMKAMEDIKDPKHFVDYTKEQVAQAQAFQGNDTIIKEPRENNSTAKTSQQINIKQEITQNEAINKPVIIENPQSKDELVNNTIIEDTSTVKHLEITNQMPKASSAITDWLTSINQSE